MNDHVQDTIRMLVANLVGEESKTFKMGANMILFDDLPREMTLEREILLLVRMCDTSNPRIPPRPETIERLLSAGDKHALIPGFRELVTRFKTDDGDVTTLAFILKRIYFQRDKNLKVSAAIQQLVESPNGLPEEQLRDAARLISREMPGILNMQPYNLASGYQLWRQAQAARNERLEAGLALGPNWPFQRLCDLIPNLKPGEVATMMMKTKFGKTTLGSVLAEHWGLTQKYRVLILLFETSIQSYMDRIIARNCEIPTFDQRTGKLDLARIDRFPDAKEKLEEYEYKIRDDADNILMLPCPGWGPLEIEPTVRGVKEEAKANGQELIVVWDYYQLINKSMWAGATQPFNESVEWLKTFTEQEGIYSFVLCQEKDDYIEPKEGTNIITRSQNFMRMHRTWADTNAPVYDTLNRQERDAMGNLRFYHQVGKLHSSAWIEILYSNDDQVGDVELRTEMALFKMDQWWGDQHPCPRQGD